MTSDAELLQRLAEGTWATFGELYRRHSDRVFRFALIMSGSRAIAEDTTQETFIHMLEHAGNFSARRSPSAAPWLLGVARNCLRALVRNDARFDTLEREPSAIQTPELLLGTSERLRNLLAAIEDLSVDHREVVILCGLLELDYESAAITLGVSIGTVRSRLSRARRSLAIAVTGRPKPSIEEIQDAI